jgi:hypothetical protein
MLEKCLSIQVKVDTSSQARETKPAHRRLANHDKVFDAPIKKIYLKLQPAAAFLGASEKSICESAMFARFRNSPCCRYTERLFARSALLGRNCEGGPITDM